jgi:hypothetical protein
VTFVSQRAGRIVRANKAAQAAVIERKRFQTIRRWAMIGGIAGVLARLLRGFGMASKLMRLAGPGRS